MLIWGSCGRVNDVLTGTDGDRFLGDGLWPYHGQGFLVNDDADNEVPETSAVR